MPVPYQRPVPVTDWLIVYNSDDARSLAEAQWYVTARGINSNLMGVKFTATPANVVTEAQFTDTTYPLVANGTSYHGVTDTAFDGQAFGTAVINYLAKRSTGIWGLLTAPYTPARCFMSGATYNTPLWSTLAHYPYKLIDASFNLPAGRLGSLADLGATPQVELMAGGYSIMRQCTTNALIAEAANNIAKPHWCSTTMAYSGYVNASDNAAHLAWMQSQGLSTINLGTDYPFNTAAPNDWYTGTRNPKVDLFALCVGEVAFNPTSWTGTSAATIAANTNFLPGSWGFTWCSYAFNFATVLIANGGSAAFTSVDEPTGAGLINPIDLTKNLMAWKCSIAEATVDADTRGVSILNVAYPPAYGRSNAWQTGVIGDPLYRPYKSTPLPVQTAYYGLLPGGVKVN